MVCSFSFVLFCLFARENKGHSFFVVVVASDVSNKQKKKNIIINCRVSNRDESPLKINQEMGCCFFLSFFLSFVSPSVVDVVTFFSCFVLGGSHTER